MSFLKGKWKCIDFLLKPDLLSRSSLSLSSSNGLLYSFSGENEPRKPINNDLLCVDPVKSTSTYFKGDESPCARVGHASCSIGNKIYIFGGRTGVEMIETSLGDLHEFDCQNHKWSFIGDNLPNQPCKRSFHAMCSLENMIYLFGGCADDRLNDLYSFDVTKKEWKFLGKDDRISVRGGPGLTSFYNNSTGEKCLYLFGGYCGHELNDCWKFDLSNNVWSKQANLPQGLSVFACSGISNHPSLKAVLHGGEVEPSKSGHAAVGEFSDVTYAFDGEKWLELLVDNSTKPSSRGWHSGCYENGKFYIFGGSLENNERTSELWELEFLNEER